MTQEASKEVFSDALATLARSYLMLTDELLEVHKEIQKIKKWIEEHEELHSNH